MNRRVAVFQFVLGIALLITAYIRRHEDGLWILTLLGGYCAGVGGQALYDRGAP